MHNKKNMDILPKYKNWNEIISYKIKYLHSVHSVCNFGLDSELVTFVALKYPS